MLTYSILFTHHFINLFTHLSSKYPELSNVICQMPYFKGSKKGVFSPFFDPIFVLKPLYVVVETYYSLSKPQYVIRIAASAVECTQSAFANARLLGHSWHETYLYLQLTSFLVSRVTTSTWLERTG